MVIGAGAAGIAAAVAASENGHRVVVAEFYDFPGGKATTAEVGTICGLYHNSLEKPEFLVRGFARQFAENLRVRSVSTPISSKDGLHFLPYRVTEFISLGKEYLSAGNITCMYNCKIEKVVVSNGHIVSVEALYDENVSILPSVVIDCSGNALVARLGGLPLISEPVYQSAAQVFSMVGINESIEDRLSLLLIKAMAKAGNIISSNNAVPKLYLVPGSLTDGRASFKVALPFVISEGCEQNPEIAEKAHKLCRKISDLLINELTAFKNAKIDHIAPATGFRVASRTKGRYMLSGEEVTGCSRFKDGIALCSWPIEVWDQTGKVTMSYLPEYGYYEIPAGCIIAETVDNLFMAGRNISASKEAIASARVMGICLQTGYAAGVLASAKIANMPNQQAIQHIQRQQMFYL